MMKRQTPNIVSIVNMISMVSSERAIEAFFAHVGMSVEVVDRCPDEACGPCGEALDEAA